jgi:hypothetical protein
MNLDDEFKKMLEGVKLPSNSEVNRETGDIKRVRHMKKSGTLQKIVEKAHDGHRKWLEQDQSRKLLSTGSKKMWEEKREVILESQKKGIHNIREKNNEYVEKRRQHCVEMNTDPMVIEKKKQSLEKFFENNPNFGKERGKKITKRIVTPYGVLNSTRELHEKFGKSFTDYKSSKPHLYYLEEDGPGDPTYEDVYYTPYGKANKQGLKKLFDKHNTTHTRPSNWFKFHEKKFPNEYYKRREIRREWDLENGE